MKKILLSTLLICSYQVYGQQWKPLQLDFNLIGLGLQTTYQITPKWSLNAGIGVNVGLYSDSKTGFYAVHPHYEGYEPSDIYMIGAGMIAPYVRGGVKYNIHTSQKRHHTLYTRYQFTMYAPTRIAQAEDHIRENYRNGVLLGIEKYMDLHKKWIIGVEIGGALWSNYDFCVNGVGPLVNLKITRDII